LQNFLPEEKLWLEPLVAAIAEAAPLLAAGDAPGFATKVALILKPPKKNDPPAPRPVPPAAAKGGREDEGE